MGINVCSSKTLTKHNTVQLYSLLYTITISVKTTPFPLRDSTDDVTMRRGPCL